VQRLHGAAVARRVPAPSATLRAALVAQVLRRRVKPYVPDFKLAFEHVCIHTGAQLRATCHCEKQRAARMLWRRGSVETARHVFCQRSHVYSRQHCVLEVVGSAAKACMLPPRLGHASCIRATGAGCMQSAVAFQCSRVMRPRTPLHERHHPPCPAGCSRASARRAAAQRAGSPASTPGPALARTLAPPCEQQRATPGTQGDLPAIWRADACGRAPGGRGVIEEIEKQLALTADLMQPSKDTLHRRAARRRGQAAQPGRLPRPGARRQSMPGGGCLSCLDGHLVARLQHASHAGRFFAGTAGRALVRQRRAPWRQEVSRML